MLVNARGGGADGGGGWFGWWRCASVLLGTVRGDSGTIKQLYGVKCYPERTQRASLRA